MARLFSWCVSPLFALVVALCVQRSLQQSSFDCNSPYVVDPKDLIADFDTNCDYNITSWVWRSRVGTLWTNQSVPASARTLDTTRKLYRTVISSGRKIVFPIDIRPSVLPNVTVEILVSIGSVATNGVKVMWSTEELSANTYASGTPKGRSILAYDPSGCGSYIHAWGATPQISCKTPVGAGYVHHTFTFQQAPGSSTGTAKWFMNGLFQDSRTTTFAEGMPNITLNGINGTKVNDISSMTLVYLRVWNRTLSQQEAYRLAVNGSYYNYTRPIFTSPYPFAAFNPTVGGTSTVSTSCSLSNPRYIIVRNHPNGTVEQVGSGNVATASTVMRGNFTYTMTMQQCLYPSTSYSTFWTLDPATMCLWSASTSVEVWTGVAAISPVVTVVSTNKVFDGIANYSVVYNRPLNATYYPGTNIVSNFAAGFESENSFPISTVTGAAPGALVTMVSADGGIGKRFYMWFQARQARPPVTASILFPSAPTTTIRDYNGVPLFGGPWGTPTVSSILPLNVSYSWGSTTAEVLATCNASLNILFNFPLTSTAASNLQNEIECTGCAGVLCVQDPAVTLRQGFKCTVMVNSTAPQSSISAWVSASSSAADSSYTWNTGIRPFPNTTMLLDGSTTCTAASAASATATATATSSASASSTSTASATATATATASQTATSSASQTATSTATSSSSSTSTASAIGGATSLSPPTSTSAVPSASNSPPSTPSGTSTSSPTSQTLSSSSPAPGASSSAPTTTASAEASSPAPSSSALLASGSASATTSPVQSSMAPATTASSSAGAVVIPPPPTSESPSAVATASASPPVTQSATSSPSSSDASADGLFGSAAPAGLASTAHVAPGAQAGIGVGIVAFFVAATGMVVFISRRRRGHPVAQSDSQQSPPPPTPGPRVKAPIKSGTLPPVIFRSQRHEARVRSAV